MLKKQLLIPIASIMLSGTLYSAEVTLEEKISGLYVAFFNRAADESGLTYWSKKGESAKQNGESVSDVLKQLSLGFAAHPSFERAYGSLDNKAFIESIYRNTLGKDGDSQGVDYWSKLLSSGMSRSDFVSTFVEAALTFESTDLQYANLSPEDLKSAQLRQDLLANKVEVALEFTQKLGLQTNVTDNSNPESDPAYLASIEIISGITEDRATAEKKLVYLNDTIETKKDPIAAINEIYIKKLLAGKKFYLVNMDNNCKSNISKINFNIEVTQLSEVEPDGSVKNEGIKIVGNRIIFDSDTDGSYTVLSQSSGYIMATDYNSDNSLDGAGHRLYNTQADAESDASDDCNNNSEVDNTLE